MRLRREIDEDNLADMLQLKQYSISRLVITWIDFIYLRLPQYFVKITLLHTSFSIAVPDFPQAAPTFANEQLASYKAHTTLYLEKPSWHFELSRSYHLCSHVKCNE